MSKSRTCSAATTPPGTRCRHRARHRRRTGEFCLCGRIPSSMCLAPVRLDERVNSPSVPSRASSSGTGSTKPSDAERLSGSWRSPRALARSAGEIRRSNRNPSSAEAEPRERFGVAGLHTTELYPGARFTAGPKPATRRRSCGGVAERSNVPVLKTGVGATPPWVRIPPPPPRAAAFEPARRSQKESSRIPVGKFRIWRICG